MRPAKSRMSASIKRKPSPIRTDGITLSRNADGGKMTKVQQDDVIALVDELEHLIEKAEKLGLSRTVHLFELARLELFTMKSDRNGTTN